VQRGRAEAVQLVESIGASLVPLMTQAQLHRSGTVQVRVGDVVAVGTRLMGSLRAAGVDTLGELGEEVAFDPDRHDPLSATGAPEVGVPVRIRVVGLSYQDRVLRRAGVEPVAARIGILDGAPVGCRFRDQQHCAGVVGRRGGLGVRGPPDRLRAIVRLDDGGERAPGFAVRRKHIGRASNDIGFRHQ
jgi:hypothetical protein